MTKNKEIKCLVTGGAGFIGSHLTDKLLTLGYDVTVIDNLSTGKLENVNKKAKFICNKIDNQNNLIPYFIENIDFDYIFHLAADASVPHTIEFPITSNKTNVDLTLSMLETVRNKKQNGFKKFVFASSSAIYGNPNEVPTTEKCSPNILSPYALQKYTAEQYCELYKKLYKIPTVSMRFFNVYGPRQNGSGPYANVISSWASKLTKGEEIRKDGDGTQKRDFIFVSDVVDLLIEAALKENIIGVYNIGTGESYSIEDVLDIFNSYFEEISMNLAPKREGDPFLTMADTTKLFKDFGYRKFANFRESLIETIKSYEDIK